MAEVLLYLIFVITIFVALSPRLPTKNIIQTYVVPTGSMVPVIYPGAVAVVRPTTDIQEGDVIAFENPSDQYQLILHRAIKKGSLGWTTKGDANPTADVVAVSLDKIKGKLVFSIPLVGYIVSFARTKIGFLLLVLVPGIVLLFLNFRDIYQGVKEEKNKRKYKNIAVTIVAATVFVSFISSQQIKAILAQFTTVATVSGISITGAAATPSPTQTPTVEPSPSSSPTPTQSPTATPTVSPTAIPTASPTPTPSTTPVPNENGCGDFDIEISGNGENSENEVEINCEVSHVVIQINHGNAHNDIHVESNYDTEEGHEVKSEDFHPDESEEIHKINFDLCKDDTCEPENIKNKKLTITFGLQAN